MKRKIQWLLSEKNAQPLEGLMVKLTSQVESWQRYYSFLNPVQQFSEIDCLIEKEFLNLVALKIQRGIWNLTPPNGIFFPTLIADIRKDGFGKIYSERRQCLHDIIGKINLTFAIRAEKRLFFGINLPETVDIQGVRFQNRL